MMKRTASVTSHGGFPSFRHPERAAEPEGCWCPRFLWHRELSRRSRTPLRAGLLMTELTRIWKRTMSSWLLAIKLLSRTPKLNQLPRQRNTLMSIFSSLPVFSTHVV
ncbi:hypothetical protein GOODEAATRI_019994 [Goodea atripinnis]|uniref:Uncharacterized protein n=1 Tax=Goodea atripinnis TaxID=208336 RepID=A0ABV0NQ36_9TELE